MTDEMDDSYTVPFSMRLTRAQRRKLGAEAGSQTVGDYVRSRLFENPTPLKRAFRRPVQDEKALSQVLGALGNSRLSSNLNQIAKAAHYRLPRKERAEALSRHLVADRCAKAGRHKHGAFQAQADGCVAAVVSQTWLEIA